VHHLPHHIVAAASPGPASLAGSLAG
jgi:hypothetical protein